MEKKITMGRYTFLICTIIVLSQFNIFKYGVGLSGVIVPLSLLIAFMLLNKVKFKISNNFYYSIIILFLVYLSSLQNLDFNVLRSLITFTIFTISFNFIVLIPFDSYSKKKIIKCIELIGIFTSILIIINYFRDFQYVTNRYSIYIYNVYRDPNYVSSLMVPSITSLLYSIFFSKNKIKVKLYNMIGIIIIVFGIILTGSRAAILSLSVVIALLFIFKLFKNPKLKTIILLFFMIIIIATSMFYMEKISPYLYERLFELESYGNNIRVLMWRELNPLISNKPILGYGFGYSNDYLTNRGMHHSHNIFLDMLVNHGIIMLV